MIEIPDVIGHSATVKNFRFFPFFLFAFSFLFWFDYFVSLGQSEMNPLYSATNKFIFFPILIFSVAMLRKFGDARAFKFGSVFLLSLFAFAFVWNIPVAFGQTVLVDRIDSTHQQNSLTTGFIVLQVLPTSLQSSSITQFDWGIGCEVGSFNISYGIVRISGSNLIDAVLILNKTIITDTTASTLPTTFYNFSVAPTFLTPISSSEKYAIFVNNTNPPFCLSSNPNQVVLFTRLSGVDTLNENAGGSSTGITSNYIGTNPDFINSPTSAYRILGTSAIVSNQTSTSTCNALNGQSCSSTTTQLTFPSDCTTGTFLATTNHNLNLFNGTTQTQTATATTEFIMPSSNQFSNITIIDWTNQTTRNLNLTFEKTNYNSGDTVQSRCSLDLNNITGTSGITTCGLAISCIRSITIPPEEEPIDITESPFTPITEGDSADLAFQILDLFFTPFFLATFIALLIAGLIAHELRTVARGEMAMIFIGVMFVFSIAYVFLGIYPIAIGIIIVLALGLLLTKFVLDMFK